MDELQRQINDHDARIRALPDSVDPDSDIRKLQAERNQVQAEYDAFSAKIKAGGVVTTVEGLEKQQAELDGQRDQLVLAQNAPFTERAPEAQGGESAVPQGVVPHDEAQVGIPRQNVAGVVHYPNASVETAPAESK